MKITFWLPAGGCTSHMCRQPPIVLLRSTNRKIRLPKGSARMSQIEVASSRRGAEQADPPVNMAWIPGGTFRMGSDRHYPEEAPVHRVTVDGFWIDRTPVTNAQSGMTTLGGRQGLRMATRRDTMATASCTRAWLRGLMTLVILVGASLSTAPAAAQGAATPARTNAQLEQLVAPIALYPDALLSQILMASTYPLEVIEAARWSKENPQVTGQALEDAMQKQTWDPSVKALTAVPQTLQMMSDKLDWMQQLGDAFLAQQKDVL